VAAVEVYDGSVVSESELLEWCRQNLAAYKAPRRIWILEANGYAAESQREDAPEGSKGAVFAGDELESSSTDPSHAAAPQPGKVARRAMR